MSCRMTTEEYLALQGKKKRSKYGVAKPEDRTWAGKVYASKAERNYALVLENLAGANGITDFCEQPMVVLGPDTRFRPDFLVIPVGEPPFYVDVKGVETREFKKIKELWAKYARLELRVVKAVGDRFELVETVPPSPRKST